MPLGPFTMKARIKAVMAAFAVFSCSMIAPLKAQHFVDGNALWKLCQEYPSHAEHYVSGAVDAIIDTSLIYSAPGQFCMRANLSSTQVKDVACKFLAEHPQVRDAAAAKLVHAAINISFPCPDH
ncbi:Rap1a/Tai family immunity protein [Pseudogemmobacter sonorensis]|uniref:Rap1a/Tai family immunity protein n=1 Tax=Pseudogemmobacter sonorensis TaxID=2989681 RepID=UPI003F67AEF9